MNFLLRLTKNIDPAITVTTADVTITHRKVCIGIGWELGILGGDGVGETIGVDVGFGDSKMDGEGVGDGVGVGVAVGEGFGFSKSLL